MRELVLDTPRAFAPLLKPSRYKGAYGGRGSGKSNFFAERLIEDCLMERGTRAVCIREVQKTLKESSKRLIEDKLISLGLGSSDGFRVFEQVIETPGDGIITFVGMQDHNAESIKSLEGYQRAWVEEAQTLSARSLALLRPTIRWEDPARGLKSELWFSWNPRRRNDPVDVMLRGQDPPTDSVVVRANWSDNPWFPNVLEQERLDCMRTTPEQYPHVWDGDYATVLDGAYFAASIATARQEGRIGRVAADPLMTVRLFCDIGGTGAKADAFTMWAMQFIGREIRVIDYYEVQGQPLGAHLEWMRSRGYTPDRAQIWLPHDGTTHDRVFNVSYESALKQAGYQVTVVPNQGRGAASMRIEAVRRLFPSMWFDATLCDAGLAALGWYHEIKDEARNIGLGPEHDWCFSYDTLVLTDNGWREIKSISEHDLVLTPCGTRRIIRSGIVRRTDKWISTCGIRSTPEHRFFTQQGLVTAERLQKTDKLWTLDSWGLRILGWLCVMLRLDFMAAITSATQEAKTVSGRFSYTAWCMKLFMVKLKLVMKSTISTEIRTTTTHRILRQLISTITGESISQSLATNACAGFAVQHLDAISGLESDAAKNASYQIGLESSEKEELEPAYSLTVDKDHCYFVRGDDGRAYLVANSSHGSDAFGLGCIVFERDKPKPKKPKEELAEYTGGSGGWMG